MKIRPLQDRILVKRIDEEEKTKGGIIIPDTAKEKPSEGRVIAVGKGKVQEDGKIQPLIFESEGQVAFQSPMGGMAGRHDAPAVSLENPVALAYCRQRARQRDQQTKGIDQRRIAGRRGHFGKAAFLKDQGRP